MKVDVNWTELREKLAHGVEALSASQQISGAPLEELLRARARQLAAGPTVARGSTDRSAALVIRAGVERYALELIHLAGIVPFHSCSAVPGGPAELLGLINARGDVWAVFDLHRLVNPTHVDISDGGYAILMRHDRRRIAIRVDDVERVSDLEKSKVLTLDDTTSGPPVELVGTSTSASLILVRPGALWNHPAICEAT